MAEAEQVEPATVECERVGIEVVGGGALADALVVDAHPVLVDEATEDEIEPVVEVAIVLGEIGDCVELPRDVREPRALGRRERSAQPAPQILDALQRGPQKAGQLAEELDVAPATIKKTLQRLEKRDRVLRVGDDDLGRSQERSWGLIDTKRDIKRDSQPTSVPLSSANDDAVPF